MDKIWYRNPSKLEVIGRCGGDEKKTEWPRRTDKSRMLKIKFKKSVVLYRGILEITVLVRYWILYLLVIADYSEGQL